MNEITNTSGTLTANQQDAYRLDYEIKAEAKNIISGVCRIGKCLKEMKERRLYGVLGFATLEEYAESAVGLKGRAVYNYISAYETYGEEGLKKYGELGITKLAALAQLNAPDREELLTSGKAEELSTRELQEEIKKLKKQNDQLTFEFEEKSTEAENSSAELERATAEIEELKAALQVEKSTKVLPAPVMSEAEKEEIRKAIIAEQEARHIEEVKNAEREAKLKTEKEYKDKLATEKKKSEAALADYKKLQASAEKKEGEISRLNAALEKAKSENMKLQANASKPIPSGNTELLKYRITNVAAEFNAAVELLGRFEGEEQQKNIERLRTVAAMISEVVSKL